MGAEHPLPHPKAGKRGRIKNLHPIGLVSVIQKTAADCILRETRTDLLKGSVNAYAYRPNSSAEVAVMPTRLLIQKACEWGENIHNIHVGKIDIPDAFEGHVEGPQNHVGVLPCPSPFSFVGWDLMRCLLVRRGH